VPLIVDPAVAEADDEPLFASPHYGDERRRKGGFLSLFGRPRNESPQRPGTARTGGGAQAALEPADEADDEVREDLEIPSFLRRLAN
jgi:cell division protein FtsZ